jgi:hypothetical protein
MTADLGGWDDAQARQRWQPIPAASDPRVESEDDVGIAEDDVGVAEDDVGIAEDDVGVAEDYTGVAEDYTGVAIEFMNAGGGVSGFTGHDPIQDVTGLPTEFRDLLSPEVAGRFIAKTSMSRTRDRRQEGRHHTDSQS